MNTDRCETEIYANGTVIYVTDLDAKRMEPFVVLLRHQSQQRVDWSYSGGRAVIKYIGDGERVRMALEALLPTLAVLQRERCRQEFKNLDPDDMKYPQGFWYTP